MKRFNFFIAAIAILIFAPLKAQISLDRQIYSPTGSSANAGGDIELSYSIGEPVVTMGSSENYLLTQGFHQPIPIAPLEFDLEFHKTSCAYISDGSAIITNVRGCIPPYTVSWSNGGSNFQMVNLSAGSYSVTVSGTNCAKTETFVIGKGAVSNCDLVFYNAFSPNADQSNKHWIIDNIDLIEYRENRVEIFNRWGAEVWSANNYDNGNVVFSGNNMRGEALPDGTYFYVAKIKGLIYKGYIEITR